MPSFCFRAKIVRCALYFIIIINIWALFYSNCHAHDTNCDIGAGINVQSSAYKRYKTQWMPFPIISVETERFYIRGVSAGLKFVNEKNFEFSAFIAYDPTGFKARDSRDIALRSLDDRHYSIQTGIAAQFTTKFGVFHVALAGDALNTNGGYTGMLGYVAFIDYGWIELHPAIGIEWQSGEYLDYYYGISTKESARSGLSSYRARQDISSYLGFGTVVNFTDAFAFVLNSRVTFLGSETRHSPMVGASHTYSASAGLFYEF